MSKANDKQLGQLNTMELTALYVLHDVYNMTATISDGKIVAAELEGGNDNE